MQEQSTAIKNVRNHLCRVYPSPVKKKVSPLPRLKANSTAGLFKKG
jgi:hypothetical protein